MVADITENNGTLYKYVEHLNKYRLQISFMDCVCLFDAIPKGWKELLKEHPVSKYSLDVEYGPDFKGASKYIKLKVATCKELHCYFMRTKFTKPTCEIKWNQKYNYN